MATSLAERRAHIISQDGRRSLFREVLVPLELARLLRSRLYCGYGVPHGDNSPVVSIPGLIASDATLVWFNFWGGRIGYQCCRSGISYANIQDPEEHIEKTTGIVEAIYEKTRRKVNLVGHSLGGLYARQIARLRPELIRCVITLGSPINGDPDECVNPMVMAMGRAAIPMLRNRAEIRRKMMEISEPLASGITSASIYTCDDGVVSWHACLDPNPNAINVKIKGTHSGLVVNVDAYKSMAEILAKAS